VGVADVQPDFPDDVHERLAAALERDDRRAVDADALRQRPRRHARPPERGRFALVNVIGLLAYAFKGIGKFLRTVAVAFPGRHLFPVLPAAPRLFNDDNIYAMILMGLTSLYAIKGGMISVVITEVMQFTILTLTAITIGVIAIVKVTPEMIAHNIPPAG
jgi:hypothetical protein